ncbi:hypothetical protein ABZ934_28125 [Streptomyces sp. NPDC046557]
MALSEFVLPSRDAATGPTHFTQLNNYLNAAHCHHGPPGPP